MNAIASEVLSYHQIDREQVRAFFGFSSYPHLARFVAAVEGSTVVLKGVSRSFHSKQLAQNVAVRCPGVTRVTNLICVEYEHY